MAIYGPDGKLIRSVLITDETAEPEDQTASDREKPPRRRPSVCDDCAHATTRAEGKMNDTDARLWHPWLRINRALRAMLHERWTAEAWSQVRVEFRKALALRSQIRRAGWLN